MGLVRYQSQSANPSPLTSSRALRCKSWVLYIVSVLLCWASAAHAIDNVQGDIVTHTCTGQYGDWHTLCQDGNTCTYIDQNNLIAPSSSGNSGNDNVLFVSAPTEVTWDVRRVDLVVNRRVGQNTQTFTSSTSVPLTIDNVSQGNITGSLELGPFNVPASPPQTKIQIQKGNGDFGLLQYRVKCLAQPKLTLSKVVQGGPAKPEDFTLKFSSPGKSGQGKMGDPAITNVTVPSGSYTLSEDLVGGYALHSIVCNGSNVTNTKSVTLKAGDNVTCVFTNRVIEDNERAHLTLRKAVINNDGGSATSTDFTLEFAGPVTRSGVQGDPLITNAEIVAGTYALSESGPAGYARTSLTCDGNDDDPSDGLRIDAGENVTCTFTNDDLKDNRSEEETKRFVNRRLDNLLTYGPDRARMLRRLGEAPPEQQSLKDGPMKLNGAVSAPGSTATTSRTPAISTGSDPFTSRIPTGSMALGANPFSTMTQQNEVFDPSRPDMQVQSGPTSTATGVLANIAGQLMPAAQDSGTIKFSTSLSELRAVATAAEQQRQNDLMMKAGLNFADAPYVTQPNGVRPGLDVWVEGTIVRYNDDLGGVNRDGDFSVLYVGADYVVSPGILVGALVQVDDTEEDIDDPTLKGNIEGRGWMAGPYIGIRLADNLYFDARAAWGRSDNDIDLTDAENRTGSFETDRWLASATLTGNEYYGAWRFSPQISIAYGEEDYGSYSTSLQQTIPGGGASIGRVTGTMEVGYRFNGYGGSIIEPHVAISGIWNFDSDDLYVNGILADSDESRARVEGGLLITTPSGIGLRGAAGYDGIGANDFEAVSGSLWINIPLN